MTLLGPGLRCTITEDVLENCQLDFKVQRSFRHRGAGSYAAKKETCTITEK